MYISRCAEYERTNPLWTCRAITCATASGQLRRICALGNWDIVINLDAVASERREIQEHRFTSLDRAINRANIADGSIAEHFVVRRRAENNTRAREQHIDARLLVLQQMGLAKDVGGGEWQVRRDFETVLKAMQRTSDRQKMLASHGALLSDERLPLVVSGSPEAKDSRRASARARRGGNRQGGRPTLPVAGRHRRKSAPDLLHAGNGRGAEPRKLRANSFVRLRKQFENGRPVLDIEDSGDAERILHNKRHSRRASQWNRSTGRRLGRLARSLPCCPEQGGDRSYGIPG